MGGSFRWYLLIFANEVEQCTYFLLKNIQKTRGMRKKIAKEKRVRK
jgi:hypothetical protein